MFTENIIKNGLPALGKGGSVSSPMSDSSHEERTAAKGIPHLKRMLSLNFSGDFHMLQDLGFHGPRTCSIWQFHHIGTLNFWQTESQIQSFAAAVLSDVLSALGLSKQVVCVQEVSVKDLRPDVWILLHNRTCWLLRL